MHKSRLAIAFLLVLVSIFVFFSLNLILGTISIPLKSVWNILLGMDGESLIWQNIVWKTRFPQTLTALLAGAGLAISGLQMQTLFRNPLAGPAELGISSGASLGVALVVLMSGNVGGLILSRMGIVGDMTVTAFAIAGSFTVMFLIIAFSHRIKGNVVLLIMGVMIGYIANAIIGVLKYFSSDEDVKAYVIWGLGSFAKVTTAQLPYFVVAMLILIASSCLLVKTLNLLLLGDNYARNLGLNIRRARFFVIVSACTLTAITTAYCGPILFLGLAVPHLCRSVFQTSDHRILLPAVILTGASLALFCSLIARMPGIEGALPVNSVTALIGAPIAITILFRKRRNELAV
ncbi:MAG: iron ABC transporter permease [Dysgonamonadaceae bacterium]